MIRIGSFVALALVALASPATAHPHIFIDAKAVVVFDDSGALSQIRNSWTFDEEFSAWVVQGLDTNNDGVTSPEELQELADDNLKGLGEYDYYTYAGEGSTDLTFAKASEATMRHENGRVTLSFAVAPTPAYHIKDRLELAINDPEYYVAITFDDPSSVTLENAPAGCAVSLDPPKEMSPQLQDQLLALGPDIVQLPSSLAQAMRGVQGAIILSCPGGTGSADAPKTAIEAVNLMGDARPIPFNGPPPEPGLPLGRTGLLGWIAEMQKQFYAAMSDALGALRQDNTAFWLLGGLSFLYGVFHAAGPGHGKVVISSYVLANERQLRRGVVLSFVSAMIQSTVAVAFVLVAAAILQLSSMTMSRAANWIGIISYAMVALLGGWLVLRKVFFSHEHHHDHRPAAVTTRELARSHLYEDDHEHGHGHHQYHYHDHGHDHHAPAEHDDDGHIHVVTPRQLGGGWREQLAVVLGVGLRPCSGALVVLVFALSQGVLPAGIAAVFLMGLGTAITVAVLASIAAGAKGLALRFGGGGGVATATVWWLELAGAVGVLAFGLLFLFASI